MGATEKRMEQLGITLPERPRKGKGVVDAVLDGQLLYISAVLPVDENGELVSDPIKIENKKDLKNYYFSYYQEYNEANEEKILKNKELAERIKNEIKAEKSAKKSKNSKKEKNSTAEDGQTEKTE